jgi:hypothetical protein
VLQALAMRIYTDFDESLSIHLPDTLFLKKDELLKTKDNNNFLFPDDSESDTLKKLREIILDNYQDANISAVAFKMIKFGWDAAVSCNNPRESWTTDSPYHARVADKERAAEKISKNIGLRFRATKNKADGKAASLDYKQQVDSLKPGAAEESSALPDSNPKRPLNK